MEKAAKISGIGSSALRAIAADDAFSMKVEALEESVERDLAAGLQPFFVCATVGTTSTQGLDRLAPIAEVCERYDLWLHVDAAMAGTAAICPEFRYLHDGLEHADSYCFNPHKWMFTNFDCSCFWVSRREDLLQALTLDRDYLRNESPRRDEVIDYRNWQVPLGRRFRALKLWFVLRYYGTDGLQHHIRRHVELAQELRRWIEADPRFELAAPTPLNLVCFRHRAGDAENERLLALLNEGGSVYLTSTRLEGRVTLRLCIAQTMTEHHHVESAWASITAAASELGVEA